ncbi:MAG TPA: ATP-binding protein [Longimicrobiales bacterium]|nr:ATP-binding protein [Longimicrobiales bacterium]
MGRGIPLRTLLVGLTLGFGLLVLFLALSGTADAVRDSGIQLGWAERSRLIRSLLSTQLVRGLIGIVLALVLAAAIGSAATRLFDSLRVDARQAEQSAQPLWLREAQDAADILGWAEEEHDARVSGLSRSHDELNRLLEAVSEGILQLDGGGRIARANRAARRLLALPDDAVGRQIGAVVRSAELRTLLQRASTEGALPPREILFEERTLIVTARALPTPESSAAPAEPTGLAVAIADLTALRRLESVRRDFVANASHELKTPLTSIRGYAETLLDESLPSDTRRQFIATISSNADRLQRIVDDLLDLSRLESGTWQPTLETIAPAVAVREAWQDFEERAARLGVDFALREETSDPALADPSALRQILSNLFDNALRFTDAGEHIEVRIVAWPRAPHDLQPRDRRLRFLAIEVRDTGTGIPGDALPRIFERFYRVDPARSRADGGTGLGLAIVKHLTESMGGGVEAESRLGRGTTIRVVLPVASDGGAASVAAA